MWFGIMWKSTHLLLGGDRMHPFTRYRCRRFLRRYINWDYTGLVALIIIEILFIYWLYRAVLLVWNTIYWNGESAGYETLSHHIQHRPEVALGKRGTGPVAHGEHTFWRVSHTGVYDAEGIREV